MLVVVIVIVVSVVVVGFLAGDLTVRVEVDLDLASVGEAELHFVGSPIVLDLGFGARGARVPREGGSSARSERRARRR